MSIYKKRKLWEKLLYFRSMMHSFVSLLILFMPNHSLLCDQYIHVFHGKMQQSGDSPIYTGKTLYCYRLKFHVDFKVIIT